MLPNKKKKRKKEKQICGHVSVVSLVHKSNLSIRKGLDLFTSTSTKNDVEPKQKRKKNPPPNKNSICILNDPLRCSLSHSEGEVAGANICPAPNAESSAIMHNQVTCDINHSPPPKKKLPSFSSS